MVTAMDKNKAEHIFVSILYGVGFLYAVIAPLLFFAGLAVIVAISIVVAGLMVGSWLGLV